MVGPGASDELVHVRFGEFGLGFGCGVVVGGFGELVFGDRFDGRDLAGVDFYEAVAAWLGVEADLVSGGFAGVTADVESVGEGDLLGCLYGWRGGHCHHRQTEEGETLHWANSTTGTSASCNNPSMARATPSSS